MGWVALNGREAGVGGEESKEEGCGWWAEELGQG